MTRPPRIYNARLKVPVETVPFHIETGESKTYEIYQEVGTEKELVKCGGGGCVTHLVRTLKTSKITSNCQYHYAAMKYAPASKFSVNRPCTNVPLNCPICSLDAKGRKKTFWKYNFMIHMVDAHLSEWEELPMLPLELMVTTHISKKEECQMGIPESHTNSYRDNHDILDSEGITIIEEEEKSDSGEEYEENDEWTIYMPLPDEERQSRKRGLSSLSATSVTSATRDESPTKRHQGAIR